MTRNVTLSAEASLIERARERARREKTTLNEAFRAWLARYADADDRGRDYAGLMQRLAYARAGRRFSRDEMHER
jgi:hypothetical protein